MISRGLSLYSSTLISVSYLFYLAYQQDQLVQSGVIPRLVSIMREYPGNDPLVNVCLLALCNLADMGDYLLFVFVVFSAVRCSLIVSALHVLYSYSIAFN